MSERRKHVIHTRVPGITFLNFGGQIRRQEGDETITIPVPAFLILHGTPGKAGQVILSRKEVYEQYGLDLLYAPSYFRESLTDADYVLEHALVHLDGRPLDTRLVKPHAPDPFLDQFYRQKALPHYADMMGLNIRLNLKRLADHLARFPGGFWDQGDYPEYMVLDAWDVQRRRQPVPGCYAYAANLFLFRAADVESPHRDTDISNALALYEIAADLYQKGFGQHDEVDPKTGVVAAHAHVMDHIGQYLAVLTGLATQMKTEIFQMTGLYR